MNAIATSQLHEVGQSLWLDNITRDLLTSGTLERYIDELSITGLTSNPTIFDHAITKSHAYDAAIPQKMQAGKSGEDLCFELAIEDLTQAADLFGPIYDETDGIDVEALDAELQREGAKSFVDSWNALIAGLATKSETLKKAG
jgi:transaldolase